MQENAIILADPTVFDAGTIVAVGSEAADMPASNVQEIQPRHPWFATDETAAWWVIDMGVAVTFRYVTALYCSTGFTGAAGAAAQLRVRADSDQATLVSTPALADYDSLAFDVRLEEDLDDEPYVHTYRWLSDAGLTFRFWRLDVSGAAAGGGARIGRAFLSYAWRPERKIDRVFAGGTEERQQGRVTVSGSRLPRESARGDVWEATVSYLDAEERRTLRRLGRALGTSGSVGGVLYEGAGQLDVVYGTFDEPPQTTAMDRTKGPLYQANIRIKELP